MNASVLSAPSAPYGSFVDKGYAFDARIPASADEARAFLLSVRSVLNEQLLLQLQVPMLNAPMFGVDEGDGALLDAVLDAVLGALPDGGQAAAPDIDRAVQAAQSLGATRA